MAQFIKHFVQDLQQDIKIRQCGTIVFNKDNLSNVISVDLYNGQEEYSGGGSVTGAVIRPNGTTVPITNGTISGKTVSITLTENCFIQTGQIGVGIQVVNGTTKTTVLKANYNVELFETDTVIDPSGEITASVGQLVADIEAATAEIPASDMASLMAGIAPTFSTSTNYAAGAYVYYNGTLYKFTSAHSAGSWTGTDVTAVALGNDVADLKNAITDLNTVSIDGFVHFGYISYSTNKWASIGNTTYNYAIIPVSGGESIEVKSSGTRSSIFAALTNYSAPSTGDTPLFSSAEGWTTTKSVGTTSTVGTFTGTIPSDAKYFYIQTKAYRPGKVVINGYDYAKPLFENIQSIISEEKLTATGLTELSGKLIKCDRAINSAGTLVTPYDDLNTLPQGSIVTYIGQIPSHVPANVTSLTDNVLTVITYNYVNSANLIGGAVQLVVGSSGNAWVRLKYTNSKWTSFKNITRSEGGEVLVPALSTFDHIGIIGDSWSSGSVYTAQSVYDHYPKLRWGYIASKLYGFTPAFFTSPGASTKTWLTRSAGLPAMQAADAQELYICCLGINDHAQEYTIGNTTDMDDDTADSFYGSYGKIIRAIKAKAQYAKIAVALIPVYNANEDVSAYNTAIRNIADHFSIGLLDTDIDPFFNSNLFKNDRQWNHLTAVGYTGMARAINAMLAKDYDVNHSYWKYSMIDI